MNYICCLELPVHTYSRQQETVHVRAFFRLEIVDAYVEHAGGVGGPICKDDCYCSDINVISAKPTKHYVAKGQHTAILLQGPLLSFAYSYSVVVNKKVKQQTNAWNSTAVIISTKRNINSMYYDYSHYTVYWVFSKI